MMPIAAAATAPTAVLNVVDRRKLGCSAMKSATSGRPHVDVVVAFPPLVTVTIWQDRSVPAASQ